MSTCPGCQSFSDGRELFSELERLGNEFELPPDRLQRALVPLLASWTAAAARYASADPKGAVDEAQAREIIAGVMRETAHAMEHYFDLAPETHGAHTH